MAHFCEYGIDLQVFLCCYLTIDTGTVPYNGIVPVITKAPHHQDVWGSGCITPCVLNLFTRWGEYVGSMKVNVKFLQSTP